MGNKKYIGISLITLPFLILAMLSGLKGIIIFLVVVCVFVGVNLLTNELVK